MIPSWKHVTRRMSPGLSALLLMMLLAACGGSGNTASSAPPPKPPIPAPTTPAVTMKTYTGTNYSISYPQDWQTHASGNQVTFGDALGTNLMTIVIVPNPMGTQSASTLADSTLPIIDKTLMTNAQLTTVPAMVTVGGETWVERGSTGKLAITSQGTQEKMIMLIDNHPANAANTQAYEIYYFAPSAIFNQTYATDFQAMLQSFKFTA